MCHAAALKCVNRISLSDTQSPICCCLLYLYYNYIVVQYYTGISYSCTSSIIAALCRCCSWQLLVVAEGSRVVKTGGVTPAAAGWYQMFSTITVIIVQ